MSFIKIIAAAALFGLFTSGGGHTLASIDVRGGWIYTWDRNGKKISTRSAR